MFVFVRVCEFVRVCFCIYRRAGWYCNRDFNHRQGIYIYFFCPLSFSPSLHLSSSQASLCRFAYSSADFCKYFAENLPDYRKYIYTYICIYTHTYIYIYIYVKHSVFFCQTVLTGFARLLSNFEFSRTR